MKKIISKLLTSIGVLIGLGTFILGFIATFVRSVDTYGNIYDGFGRHLEHTPIIVRTLLPFLGSDPMWGGFAWAIVDFITFWGLLGLAYFLISSASKIYEKNN